MGGIMLFVASAGAAGGLLNVALKEFWDPLTPGTRANRFFLPSLA
jgi:hypothetical protein